MPNSVILKKYVDIQDEQIAAATITPGMLVEFTSTANTVQAHSSPGQNAAKMFAKEDALQGNGLDDDYSATNKAQILTFIPGEEVYAILKDGENVSRGDFLESAGDGTLQKHEASSAGAVEYPNAIVGVALESLNLSGGSSAESSGLWGNQRIKVKIV